MRKAVMQMKKCYRCGGWFSWSEYEGHKCDPDRSETRKRPEIVEKR